MANTNIKEILTKAGTTAAFALAMTAAMAIPANASETDENLTPPTENPPVQEPAPAQTSSDVQEVAEHNAAVETANEQTVQENNNTAGSNASGIETVVSGNETTGSENETAAENAGETVSGNEEIAGGNDIIDAGNQETDKENEKLIEGNEELKTELPDAPEKPNTPENPGGIEAPELPGSSETPEVPETPENPDLSAEDPEDYNENVGDYNEEVKDYNDGVEDTNGEIDDYNNEQVKDYNDGVQDTNQQIGDYNDQVKDYNDQVDGYNNQVKDYNGAVDEINDALNKQHEENLKEWEGKKDAHDKDVIKYEEDEKTHAAKTNAFAAYEAAIADMQAAYDALGENPTEEDLAAYEAAIAEAKDTYAKDHSAVTEYADGLNAYAANLEEKLAWAQDKKEYDEKVDQDGTRQEIYDEVQEYNKGIEGGNVAIEEANKALKDGLHANVVGSLAEAEEAKLNAAVDAKLAETPEGQAVLETLSEENRKALEGETTTLAETAAALKAEGEKGYDLGSAQYADYLARVKEHNAAVEALNNKLAAYNDAVAEYNKHVDDYNANKPEDSTTTTGGGTQQEEGHVTDWGNINIDDYTLGHADVKYQAAASKDKKVDEEGNETYTDTVTQYTVTGVYTSKTSYENGGSYGLTFDNDGDGSQKPDTQVLYVNGAYSEFSHMQEGNFWNHKEVASIDPDSGTVSFYVTLKDAKGVTHGIDVNLNGNSVYAKGSYYKASDNDYLSKFRYMDENGNPIKDENGNEIGLPTVSIGGEEYYDISDQSVFLISALTCDGMKEETTGKGWNQKPTGWLNPDGLDLILNLQTMIDIHKADNAKKITYQGYQLGMLAAAEAPGGGPGEFTDKEPGDIDLLEGPGEFTDTHPGDFTEEAPTLVQLNHLKPIEKKLNPVQETLKPIDELTHINELKELDQKMILVIPEEIPEEEPVWFNDDIPVVDVIDLEEENGPFVQILDEDVPLADVPKTGDVSLLFGMSSLISLSGLYLTGKKRNRRD